MEYARGDHWLAKAADQTRWQHGNEFEQPCTRHTGAHKRGFGCSVHAMQRKTFWSYRFPK